MALDCIQLLSYVKIMMELAGTVLRGSRSERTATRIGGVGAAPGRHARVMGLYFARTGRSTGDEPCASITWREYVAGLSVATDPAEIPTVVLPEELRLRPGDAAADRPLGGAAMDPGSASAVAHLEIVLRLVKRRARRAIGLPEILRLECEAAKLRLLLIPLYVRLGEVDKARSLAREAQAVL
jgi:hypothetical protein